MAAAPPKPSWLARISFIIAMFGVVAWMILLVTAAAGVRAGASEESLLMMTVGLFMFAGLAANLVGGILGIVALASRISNRWAAITGIIVNAVELFGVLFLIVLGFVLE